MSGIRLADIPDVKHITELGLELLEQSVYQDIKPDTQKFRLLVANMIGSNKGRVLVVVDDDDKPQGFLLGMIDDLFFSQSRYATDLAFYIREGYRHLAPRMVKDFIAWATGKPKVVHIAMGVSSGVGDVSRIGRMYEGLGMTAVGGIYVLEN